MTTETPGARERIRGRPNEAAQYRMNGGWRLPPCHTLPSTDGIRLRAHRRDQHVPLTRLHTRHPRTARRMHRRDEPRAIPPRHGVHKRGRHLAVVVRAHILL